MTFDADKIKQTVFVVDDDQAVRDSLRWLIESVDLPVQCFESADQFLKHYQPHQAGCLLLDVRMPGMGGLELQDYLKQKGINIPVIIITGHGDVPMSVQAMKKGAVDFFEKPFNSEYVLIAVRRALAEDRQIRDTENIYQSLVEKYASLTPREKEVMSQVTLGHSNKVVARMLGVSVKTVEAHRARAMEKMEANSLAELVRMNILIEQKGRS